MLALFSEKLGIFYKINKNYFTVYKYGFDNFSYGLWFFLISVVDHGAQVYLTEEVSHVDQGIT